MRPRVFWDNIKPNGPDDKITPKAIRLVKATDYFGSTLDYAASQEDWLAEFGLTPKSITLEVLGRARSILLDWQDYIKVRINKFNGVVVS